MVAHRKNKKERKVQVLVGLHQEEIAFLDRKIKKDMENCDSRSAIICWLVRQAMEHPEMLDQK